MDGRLEQSGRLFFSAALERGMPPTYPPCSAPAYLLRRNDGREDAGPVDDTPNLALPYIMPAQAQKHITHNEALRALDAIVQLMALDRDLAAPPGSSANGDRYIVAAGASGEWAGRDANVAAYQDGAWAFYLPQEGWIAWVADENAAVVWDGAAWTGLASGGGGGGGSVNPTPRVGVNATADTTNRLSVSSPASLFNHEGNGHQAKINKAAATDTASILFQTGFSGRAEMGTTGDDDYHFKVSPDGSTWHEAILIDKDTGECTFPNTSLGGGGGGGGFELLTAGTVSSAAELAIVLSSYSAAVYSDLMIAIQLMPATDSVDLYARTSTDGGSNYDAASNDYSWAAAAYTSAAAVALEGSNAGSNSTFFMVSPSNVGNQSNEGYSGWVRIFNPLDASTSVKMLATGTAINSNGSAALNFVGGARMAAADVDAIKFYFQSGNIASGSYQVYGCRKA